MPLKKQRITIDSEGRDYGKTFEIAEMPALTIEWWSYRALQALSSSGVDVPTELMGSGGAGVAAFGFRALANIEPFKAKPLLDEMLTCIRMCPDPRHHEVIRELVEGDIEEVSTLFKLRMSWFDLHVGFSMGGNPSTSQTSASTFPPDSGTTQIVQAPLRSSPHRGKRHTATAPNS